MEPSPTWEQDTLENSTKPRWDKFREQLQGQKWGPKQNGIIEESEQKGLGRELLAILIRKRRQVGGGEEGSR